MSTETALIFEKSYPLNLFSTTLKQPAVILKSTTIDTPLGPMFAVASDEELFLLEFLTKKRLDRELSRLNKYGFSIVIGECKPLQSISTELTDYFEGTLKKFKTPFRVLGSVFQQKVWNALCQIQYGETRSYAQQATLIDKPTAYRAVANANGANQLSIIIPCHRIIASDGTLGGYGGGIAIKKWLLEHEQCFNQP